MAKKVSVIGAGVAGLASAVRLQTAGYDVTIYEKNEMAGGKMYQIEQDGFTFDLGPSIVMMPDLYKEVFEQAGRNPDDYIPMQRLDPMYSAFFGDEQIDVSSDLVKLVEHLEGISEEDVVGFLSYLRDIYERFVIAKNHFIQRPFRKFTDFYNPFMLRQAWKLKTFDSANHTIGKYVKDKRLQQILSFQTLYIGISPNNGPSIYTIIPMIEYMYGIWFIKGGMYTMARSMERLFLELGGRIEYGAEVDEIVIEGKKATGIKLNGEKILSDYVMCNADFPYAMKNLVLDKKAKGKYTDKKIDSMDYSCSCFIMYLGMDRKYDAVENIHNIVFSQDLDENMEEIFSGKLLDNPSFYVYIASKLDEELAPKGKDGLYILAPVSDLSTAEYEWNEETIAHYRHQILNKLKTIKGFETVEDDIISESYMTPEDFKAQFNAYNGATFGLRPTLAQSNQSRPQAKSTTVEQLYFTGSSTHPGAGVPIVLTSAKIATEELMLDDGKKG
ncbi:Phytoene dehydrogenase [Alkalibacterium sp. AK22]|uniref:phytoene desaturase family protein n=1 Tax=Alkalibacterium sp. AK22 TaxID=1229520 RepID=UPI0004497DB6|nr:phytoene desaturase family protein [Alkalibacterium sp. AK22]EXJ24209.1 Phytoene dehydrogenase [Alkalibacterium sp. AK22]